MGLVHFVTTTGAGYSGITSKDKDTLYFISDERRIYKGEVPYSGGIFTTVAEFPETGEVNTLYVNSATGEVRYYNGTSYQTVVPATGKSITGKGDGSLATTAAVAAYVTSQIGDLNISALKGRVDTLEGEMDTAQGQITTINGAAEEATAAAEKATAAASNALQIANSIAASAPPTDKTVAELQDANRVLATTLADAQDKYIVLGPTAYMPTSRNSGLTGETITVAKAIVSTDIATLN